MSGTDEALNRLGRTFEPCDYELHISFNASGWTLYLKKRPRTGREEVMAQASLPYSDLAIETACRMLHECIREKNG